ncbi:MAG: TMEM175 family protein, partial [Methanomicrobiales archaeon]|nr:TMEM175 family protein [Methanomicrobiales archaeon]
ARIIVENIPGFLHYVIAFAALAGFWVGHHMQFHALRFVDRKMIWLNISFLLFVALVPFSADLVGDYPSIALASIIFEVNLFAIGGFLFLQWLYATEGRRLVAPQVTDSGIARGLRRNLVLPGISLAGILLAVSGVGGTTFVYLAVPPLLLLAGEWNPQGANPP